MACPRARMAWCKNKPSIALIREGPTMHDLHGARRCHGPTKIAEATHAHSEGGVL